MKKQIASDIQLATTASSIAHIADFFVPI